MARYCHVIIALLLLLLHCTPLCTVSRVPKANNGLVVRALMKAARANVDVLISFRATEGQGFPLVSSSVWTWAWGTLLGKNNKFYTVQNTGIMSAASTRLAMSTGVLLAELQWCSIKL